MNLALDTNRYVDLCKNVPEVVQRVRAARTVVIPFVVLAELRAGFLAGKRAAENQKILTSFLNQPGVSVLHADDQTTHHYAQLYVQLRQQGTPIPTNDLWIASLIVQHGLLLYARDAHFDHLPQVTRI